MAEDAQKSSLRQENQKSQEPGRAVIERALACTETTRSPEPKSRVHGYGDFLYGAYPASCGRLRRERAGRSDQPLVWLRFGSDLAQLWCQCCDSECSGGPLVFPSSALSIKLSLF